MRAGERLSTRRARRIRRSSAGAVALTAVVLAGCVATADPAALPEDVTVSLVQLRSDVAARTAQVRVRNDSTAELVVGAVSVRDGRLTDAAARPAAHETRIAAGRTVDLRIQLPTVACPGASGGATLDIDLDARTVSTPIEEAIPFLDDLHERECRAQQVERAASITLSEFTPAPAGQAAELVLEVRPTGTDGAVIRGIRSTNLLTFAGAEGQDLPLDVVVAPGDTAPIRVVLPLVPARCDPHAVLEDKRGTVFTLDVEVHGESAGNESGAPGEVLLAAPDELRGRILSWVAQWCAPDR